MLQHKYIHGCFKATATQKLFLLQGTRCWLRPTACSELLAPLPSSAHTCTPAPTHLQAAQGEQRAGLHLPTVTPQQEMVAALRKRVVQPPRTSLSSGFAICSLRRVQMYLSFTARQSSMGPVFRDTKQSQSQREALQALSILARRSTPSQTSPLLLTARMETGSQDSLQVVSPVAGMAISYFFSSGFCCAVATVGGLRAVSYFQASKTLRQ